MKCLVLLLLLSAFPLRAQDYSRIIEAHDIARADTAKIKHYQKHPPRNINLAEAKLYVLEVKLDIILLNTEIQKELNGAGDPKVLQLCLNQLSRDLEDEPRQHTFIAKVK